MVKNCLGDSNLNAVDDECERIQNLQVSKTQITWDTHIVAQGYDVVRGDILGLHATGNFTGNVGKCLADDHGTNILPWNEIPAAGDGYWVLVRGVWTMDGESVGMTYGNAQRDDQIKSDPDDCDD
jgi:hypothetical protein